jgi:hypothetical protein
LTTETSNSHKLNPKPESLEPSCSNRGIGCRVICPALFFALQSLRRPQDFLALTTIVLPIEIN